MFDRSVEQINQNRAMHETHSHQSDTDLPKLAAPARRALAAAGYWRLEQLAQVRETDLKQLHGIGPTAIETLRRALAANGLSFARDHNNRSMQAQDKRP
jgi:hypothetical protein